MSKIKNLKEGKQVNQISNKIRKNFEIQDQRRERKEREGERIKDIAGNKKIKSYS